ncbi:acylphosphatase [Desulfobacterium sp. N47]|uniref:Acylphosphatase n=1 Tax=uncultured Desulfobacterium sp. TaxID=201089 RepID=E1YBR7_9BACT|nr:Acylphosphatase [uncultured Desulfobacterium sp.]
MKDKTRVHVIISGKVQGVFFRMETKRVADSSNVSGWVKNNSDGTVEAVFEGAQDAVDSVVKWCRKGPSHSKVSHVDKAEEDYKDKFKGFDIIY